MRCDADLRLPGRRHPVRLLHAVGERRSHRRLPASGLVHSSRRGKFWGMVGSLHSHPGRVLRRPRCPGRRRQRRAQPAGPVDAHPCCGIRRGYVHPASTPPVVERSDWEIVDAGAFGAHRGPGRVQGFSGRAVSPKSAARPTPAHAPLDLPREGDYVFSFDGQLGEPVVFIALDGQSSFVGKRKGERGGDTEKLASLHPGVANDWNLTAARAHRRARSEPPPGPRGAATRLHQQPGCLEGSPPR